jgi:hypothetical protein
MDSKYAKFEKMRTLKLPEGAIRQKMQAEGISISDMESFFNSEPQIDAASLVACRSLPQGWSSQLDASSGNTYYYHQDSRVTQWEYPAQNESTTDTTLGAGQSDTTHSKYIKFHKMRQLQLPDGAIRQKMLADGMGEVDIDTFFKDGTGAPLNGITVKTETISDPPSVLNPEKNSGLVGSSSLETPHLRAIHTTTVVHSPPPRPVQASGIQNAGLLNVGGQHYDLTPPLSKRAHMDTSEAKLAQTEQAATPSLPTGAPALLSSRQRKNSLHHKAVMHRRSVSMPTWSLSEQSSGADTKEGDQGLEGSGMAMLEKLEFERLRAMSAEHKVSQAQLLKKDETRRRLSEHGAVHAKNIQMHRFEEERKAVEQHKDAEDEANLKQDIQRAEAEMHNQHLKKKWKHRRQSSYEYAAQVACVWHI